MIRKKGKLRRQLVVLGSAFGSTGELARSLWRGGMEKKLMMVFWPCLRAMLHACAKRRHFEGCN